MGNKSVENDEPVDKSGEIDKQLLEYALGETSQYVDKFYLESARVSYRLKQSREIDLASFVALESEIGEYIRDARQQAGYSQAELAQQMSLLGFNMHQTTIAKTESGNRPLRVAELYGFADCLDVPVISLMAHRNVPASNEAEVSPLDEVEDAIAEMLHTREDLLASLKDKVELIAKQYGEYTTRLQNKIASARRVAAEAHSNKSPEFVQESDELAAKWLKLVGNTNIRTAEQAERADRAHKYHALQNYDAFIERNKEALAMIEDTEEKLRQSVMQEDTDGQTS